MASQSLQQLTTQLQTSLKQPNPQTTPSLLTKAKLALLHADALVPTPSTSAQLLAAGRTILELGALISIKLQDAAAFTRYFQQLQPFYTHPSSESSQGGLPSQRSKITGLYLLLLLSQSHYAAFHTLLESLEVAAAQSGTGIDDDEFIQYPVRIEQWLMEGSYDRVWEECKGPKVPSEEFAVFSDILINTTRTEIASCSAKAYPSIPIPNAKSLLFLDSEGSVVKFSESQNWSAHDGRIYFPQDSGEKKSGEGDVMESSGMVIEHALGYARELEMIV